MAKKPPKNIAQFAGQLETAGRFADAKKAWLAAVKAQPKNAKVRLGLARFANRRMADPIAALPHVLALVKLAPDDVASHQEAAETFARLERFSEARKHAAKAARLAPKSADVAYVAATIENLAGSYDRAEKLIDKALDLRPDHMPSELLRATILAAKGDMATAQALCRDLFERSPENAEIAHIYQRTGKMSSDDPIITHLRDVLRPSLPEGAKRMRARVETTLGKVASDENRHEDAFSHYTLAKQIDPAPFDLLAYRRHVTELINGIKRPAYIGRAAHDSDAPVLIVGMPRSGSTLLEQILSGHPSVASSGESPALRNIAVELDLPVRNGRAQAAAIAAMTDRQAKDLGAAYLRSLDGPDGKTRIIDKRLHNFELLGLFARLFPKGRILHTVRDPMDTCVSTYMQPFRKSHAYAWKLDDLGPYYLEYRRLMQHWHRELPNTIQDVAYEDIVADTERVARHVIAFLDLDWHDRCLSFQTSENRSRTMSQWQVRQPIYATSVEKWRRYDARLGPLKAALSRLYPAGALE